MSKKIFKIGMYKNQYKYFIKRLLKEKKLTINAFCVIHNLPRSAVYDICSGVTKKIEPSTLRRIALAFGYTGLKQFLEAFQAYNDYGLTVHPKDYVVSTKRENMRVAVLISLIVGLIALGGYLLW